MNAVMLQLQLLLAALAGFLPLVPHQNRARIAAILELVSAALAAGGGIVGDMTDLARKIAAIREEIERAAAADVVSPAEFDAVLARIAGASAQFRAALRAAEEGA